MVTSDAVTIDAVSGDRTPRNDRTRQSTSGSGRGPVAEDVPDAETEHEVEDRHQDHHDDDEHEHDARVAEEFLAGRGDDLAQLAEDLADEQCDRGERATALSPVDLCLGDDVVSRLHVFARHFNPSRCAGRTGLEPATCGFGDRCSTN